MKSFYITIVLLLTNTSFLFAKAKILIGERQVLNQVYDLPNTDTFKLKNGNYLDLATLHKEFNIAYILPLYITQEPKLVAFDKETDMYFDIPEKDLKSLLAAHQLKENEINSLPFYTRYGAKLIVILFIAFLIWGNLPSKKSKITPKLV